jgi:ubiquinone biosynthesis monooxygenase Coq6
MQYLHQRILDADASGVPISPTQIQEEISWRERSHSINPHSAYASSVITPQVGIPPEDSGSVPPLVTSIQSGSAASFPLRFTHADAYIGEGESSRTVLVGDAAHTVHPLAGQGLNMGLADVECLAHRIQDAVLSGGDVGEQDTLTLPY